ncbi:hypothetical protein G9G39_17075 [Cronobacter sp. EKM101R]|uniref:RecE family exodeoxyribonuclease n=1 Tax=unclassified Cronobacter TaxID=2649764 RepID=UPI0013EBD637|nr:MULTISPECIES: RecE family exodeoxyribonuclease [unclassified Cronobacter]KAF6592562.1 hypothetical protein G9G39_17075 [Cronobacter sp. EKM101R]KAF6594909.1 hypothetical protein G9G38_17045 [Cronobacter sp. EKM102R]
MSNKPIFLIRKAKKSSGLPDAVFWCSDDFESANATLDYLLIKSGNKLSSYFKAVATHFPVVDDLPEEGEVNFTWCDRYELGEDNMTWELKPGAIPADVHHQPQAESAAPETTETRDAAEGEEYPECEAQVIRLATIQRFLHIYLFATEDTKYLHHATQAQRKQAIALEMDMDNSQIQNLISGLRGLEFLDKLDNGAMLRLSGNIKTAFPDDKKADPVDYRNFAVIWNETRHPDRGLLAKEWGKENRVTGIRRTQSGANAGGGILTDRGEGFVHDQASLERDVATGVLARSMDIDIYNPHPAHVKRVSEIVAENKPPFSAFRDAFIAMPGGLDYSRAIVVASVKEATVGLEAIPARVTEYLNRVLNETDHAHPDQLIVDIACGRSSSPLPQCGFKKYENEHDENTKQEGNQPAPAVLYYHKNLNELHEARENLRSKDAVDTDKLLAAGRGEFVEGISDPNDLKWTPGHQNTSNEVEKTENGEGDAEENQRQEAQPAASVSDVHKSLSERPESEQENLALWKNVFKTDERFTRAFAVNGGGTSINGTYMTMIATREFGPKGIGWGVDILEERFDDGAPLTRKNGDSQELITDGNGNFLTEKHHVIKIRLWYIRNGQRGQEVAYGCTPYITNSKYGVVSDGEAPKKSLTDATKKALSSLGFCADIFMGLYDNAEYRSRNKAEFDLINASENAEDAARLRRELDERLTRVADTLSSAVSTSELKKVYDTLAREVDVHRKAADSKGDAEYAKYLGGRLRRLTQIKDQRMAALTGKEEQSA